MSRHLSTFLVIFAVLFTSTTAAAYVDISQWQTAPCQAIAVFHDNNGSMTNGPLTTPAAAYTSYDAKTTGNIQQKIINPLQHDS
jgi:hypothetical protein